MLNVIEYGKDNYEFPALIVLGCFDAIHVGHRELLKKAKLQAKINGLDLGVMIFRDGKSGKLVRSFEERLSILEQFNVKFVVAIDYNEEFKSISALDFLHGLEENINVKAYMSGKDFRFGAQAKGKSSTLKSYAEDEDNGVWYMPIKDIALNGEKVSTTLIKSCLEAGNVAKANELLVAEFSLTGEVVHGEGRGTSIVGFPTVNIEYPEWKYPLKHGVYSVKCFVDDTDYQGIANFGTCPTFYDKRVILEVYLEGFSGDLYGKLLTVRFIDYIRDIEEFASAEELSDQLKADLQTANEEMAVTESAEEVAAEIVETVTEQQPVEVAEEQPAEETVEETIGEVGEESDGFYEEAEEYTDEIIVSDGCAEETVIEESPIEETEEVAAEVVETVTEQQPVEVAEEQPAEETVEETVGEVGEESDGFYEEAEEYTDEIIVSDGCAEETVIEESPIEETEEAAGNVIEEINEEIAEEDAPLNDNDVEEEPVEEEAEELVEEPVDVVVEEIIEEEAMNEVPTEEAGEQEETFEEEVAEEQTEEAEEGEQNNTEDGE